ncbi:hypothetical protein L218DRAFT_1007831 [Marasmius fiardii PR-910]|nr:hypothetical protein L218DRAFT_1007831 [Marasmius fiardii PR-910]
MPQDQQELHHPQYPVELMFRDAIVVPILVNSSQLFLYGLYIFIFRIAIMALKKRPRSRECRFHIVALNLLFILATVDVPLRLVGVIFYYKLVFWEWLEGLEITEKDSTVVLVFNLLADSVMVFRFFVIWGYRRIYAIIPMAGFILVDVLAVSSAVILAINESTTATIIANAALGGNGFLNLTLTVLIAVKIWWEAHKIGSLMGSNGLKRGTNTIIAIVLESGILYAMGNIIFIICNFFPVTPLLVDLGGILVQVAGIAPTLIVARANSRRRADRDVRNSEEGEVGTEGSNVITLTQLQAEIITPVPTSVSAFSCTDSAE